MPTVQEIYAYLDQKCPFSLQESWDNSGFLVGHGGRAVETVFVSLDITPNTVREAAEAGAQLMVSHHPVIFHPAKRLTDAAGDYDGAVLLSLAEQGIAAICCHTNLDAVAGGVNDVLAEKCGLRNTALLEQSGVDAMGRPFGIGRVGELPAPVPLAEYLENLKAALGSNGLRYVSGGKPVSRVAVGGGACGDMIDRALALGCDTFVTSDLKYNAFLSAPHLGLNLIDAGHFPTENPVTEVLARWLREGFPTLRVTKSGCDKEVICYF